MIPNWRIRLVVFFALAVPLTWYGYQSNVGEGPLASIIGILFGLGMACFSLFAAEPDHFPEPLAKTFTVAVESSAGVSISSPWTNNAITITSLLPILAGGALAGLFDHSFFPDEPGMELCYTGLGILLSLGLIFVVFYVPTGYRSAVSKRTVVWSWTYFGRKVLTRVYQNVRIVEYAATNGEAGGPVVTIDYERTEGDHGTAKLRYRNVYGYSREQFGDILADYLGEPDRRVFSPTSRWR